MRALLLLGTVALLQHGCGAKLPPPDLTTHDTCPEWSDVQKAKKARLADEIEAAPADAVWPDVLVADQGLKDQLTAAGCGPRP